jgi:TonB family protein
MAPAEREELAMNTAASRIDLRPDNPLTPSPYLDPHVAGHPALEVRASYKGVLIGARFLADEMPVKRARSARGLDPRTHYVIGQSPCADAPAPCELLGTADLPLVSKWSEGFLVNVTPHMTGDVDVGGRVYRLADYLVGRGCNFTLPPNARARIDCGAMSFRLDHTTRAEPLPRRWFDWRWAEHKFTLGSFLALGLFLLMICAIPPEGVSVSSDFVGMSRPFVPITVTAPEPDKTPEILAHRPGNDPGEAGKAHARESGKMGDPHSKKPSGAYSIRGEGKDVHLGKAEAAADVLNRGILGVLRSSQATQFADIFGRDSAVGDAQESILGNLVGNQLAGGWGAGGWGVTGSGAGGGGANMTTIGVGNYNTLGRDGYGHGPGIGGLHRRVSRGPEVIPGTVSAKGSLDKEIIRRIVHLHMNEVKYCYDQELVRKAGLEGRLSVQFVISPFGQVISSVVQSSTMGNIHVEKCVVDAVKRWEFPKPTGGGIAIVSYPFNFMAGSGR